MTSTEPLNPAVAFAAGVELFAAWPCPPSKGSERRGMPSPAWERQYLDLRKQLLVGRPPTLPADAAAVISKLQRELSDHSKKQPPPDIAYQWAQSFAALCRVADIVQGRRAPRADEGGR